jgi:glycerol-3-phosphate acyltransferase PlsX
LHPSTVLALDAMGGDGGPAVVVEAALAELERVPGLELILVGAEGPLQKLVSERTGGAPPARLHLQEAPEVIAMEDNPIVAVRQKKHASMRIAIDLVHTGAAQACVSAGNTGALMVLAKMVLKMLPGLDRPAICAAIPTRNGHTLMLDLGANAVCTANQLVDFAVMGSALAQAVHGISQPTLGLLNIGTEEIKGHGTIREAHERLSKSGLNYRGFIEGNDINRGRVDVIVSDGFAGNVALKTMEGTAHLINDYVREEFSRTLLSRISGLVVWPVIRSLRQRLDPRLYNGASFLGVNGIVVKSHGNADAVAFRHAIRRATSEVQNELLAKILRLQRTVLPPTEEASP